MDLWVKGLVYHGTVMPQGPRRPCADAGALAGLHERVAQLYRLVFAGDSAGAWKLVATLMIVQENETEDAARVRFDKEIAGRRMASWKLPDRRAFDFDLVVEQEGQPSFRASKLGVVNVTLSLRSIANSVERRHILQHWLYSESLWWVCWRGFNPPVG